MKQEKPVLKINLKGPEGNAFYILSKAKHVAEQSGWDKERIERVIFEATSGDYQHLLKVMSINFNFKAS